MLITRLSADAAAQVAQQITRLDYREEAKVGIVGPIPPPDGMGKIVVATGGTSAISPWQRRRRSPPRSTGNEVVRLYDVGVAGLHRLLAHLDEHHGRHGHHRHRRDGGGAGQRHRRAGRLPGHRRAHQRGLRRSRSADLSALLSMLNSCASGVSVVNIDNGFGAGYLASMINHMEDETK